MLVLLSSLHWNTLINNVDPKSALFSAPYGQEQRTEKRFSNI
jgi:hypothetical protein